MKLPTLYKKTSTGAIQQWYIETIDSKIITTHGQVDGKLQKTEDIIHEGKNAGKANATTAAEQAAKEAQAKWEKQLKKGYVKTLKEAEAGTVDDIIEGGVVPMLAHRYDKFPHKISWPALASPKLDGIRCVAVIKNGVCTLWSRTRKPITSVPHIVQALEREFDRYQNRILDGELFVSGISFEAITSLVRPDTPVEGHEKVEYRVFDLVEEKTFSSRYEFLKKAFSRDQHPLYLVKNTEVQNEQEALELFHKFLEAGHEGLMLRNCDSNYEHKRSYNLQKVKLMTDEDFPIVGVKEGRGKMAGLAIFQCECAGGIFDVKMKGSLEELAKYFQNSSLWKGKKLTVQYQNLTEENKPRFPVGLRIREDF